jgi:hypothetical protein
VRILALAIFALSLCAFAAEKYGVYDSQGNRVSTFEAEPHELPEKTRQIKGSYLNKKLYVSSLKKGKSTKPSSRYKAETRAYIEASRNETFSICPEKKSQGTWISEHSVALDEKNCISVQAPNLAGTFRVLFMEDSGLTDTIQVLVDQSYIQMGDYSHRMYVVDTNQMYPGFWIGPAPGNYESRSYSQPLIVDKTKFTMGDAQYYAKNCDVAFFPPSQLIAYPENEKLEESKLPLVGADYNRWKFANLRSKKEGLDTVYINNPKDGIMLDTSASGYRLPSEEEWFFLMRAGASTRYYWGDEEDSLIISHYEWFRPVSRYEQFKPWSLRPVAQFQPNRFGLYDMAGIAYEACGGWLIPECYFFMTGMAPLVQYMEKPDLEQTCVFKRNEKDKIETYCVDIDQTPILKTMIVAYQGFRLLRKTPKLHKLEKF